MEILRLAASTYLPNDLIEGYTSVIWTERYLDPGEFSIVSPNIASFRALLPIGTLLSLRDSKEVMRVETHAITKDQDGVRQLTISGRSFETFMEDRVSAAALSPTTDTYFGAKYTFDSSSPALGARYFMRDLTVGNPPENPDFTTNPLSTYDTVPNIEIYPANSVASELISPAPSFSIPLGQLLEQATALIKNSKAGIRCLRPEINGATTRLWIQIYRGFDRTSGQSTNPPVVFRVDAGHFVDVNYLFSKKGSKNVAYVFSPLGSIMVYRPGTPTNVSGLNRRVLFVDATDLTALKSGQDLNTVLTQRGLNALAQPETKETTVFDGKVSPNIPFKFGYNKDYWMGDLITVQAEYGISQTMMVSEYIRSQDKSGEVGYPTLVDPNA